MEQEKGIVTGNKEDGRNPSCLACVVTHKVNCRIFN